MTSSAPALTVDISTSTKSITSNCALVSGRDDLVLIDTCMRVSDAETLVDWIRATGKSLREIHLTHAHPDHYFGINVVRAAFPGVEVFADRGTAETLCEWPAKVRHWAEVYGPDDLPWQIDDVMIRDDSPILLDGHVIQPLDIYGTESVHMRFFHVPSARTLIVGDLVYNGMHILTADVGNIEIWVSELERVRASYAFDTVIMGHGKPGGPEVFDFCIDYLQTKQHVSAPKVSIAEVAKQMTEAYPDLAVPQVLYWTRGPGYGFRGPEALGMPSDLLPATAPRP